VGGLVAQALGVPFRDTDADIEATAGKPISDIFVDDGEDAFRTLERSAVADALPSWLNRHERCCAATPWCFSVSNSPMR
jgi:shikimate kinase